ncbi:CDP-diacylglycerol--serine O-phosphatidyltransferase [Sorangium sp. So ce854]|uniref:CDP-diacylglycerol--serine O-phosphatidyltransferase n=1 Tax=Sorangium sp. So ce854 TaxID=3133322 RepID=UPI003F5E3F59
MIRKRRRFELRKTLFLLPNLITLSSIFCGFDSIRRSATAQSEDDFYRAALLIVFAMFFDTLDGRVARMTKTQSAFGLQIDSLADIVSFGVAPSILVYQWTLHRFDLAGLLVSFFFTACGAVRLARFNVLSMGEAGKPTKPSKYIVGLPIPGAAGILVSIVVADHAAAGAIGGERYASAILATTTILSLLMVSTIRFRSFKDLRLNVRTVLFVAFAIGSSAVISTQLQPAFVLVWLLGFYVLLGIFESLWHLPARLRGLPRDSAPPPRVPPAA